jgi:superfamily II DNA helicase RecQ
MSFFFTALQIIKTDNLTKTKNQHQKDNDHDFFNSKHKNAENKQFRAMANKLISYNLIQKNISLYNKPKKALKESSNNHIEENKLKCKNNKTDLSEDKCVTR